MKSYNGAVRSQATPTPHASLLAAVSAAWLGRLYMIVALQSPTWDQPALAIVENPNATARLKSGSLITEFDSAEFANLKMTARRSSWTN